MFPLILISIASEIFGNLLKYKNAYITISGICYWVFLINCLFSIDNFYLICSMVIIVLWVIKQIIKNRKRWYEVTDSIISLCLLFACAYHYIEGFLK